MAKKKQTLEQIETSLARWRTRAKRAMTMLDKLEKQKKRLLSKRGLQEQPPLAPRPDLTGATAARGSSDEPASEKPSTSSAPVPPAPVAQVERAKPYGEVLDEMDHQAKYQPAVADDIPAFLRRQTAPSPVAEAIRQEQAETKRLKAKGRIAKMKAKKAGDLRKMPLTGKAALAAIRGQ